MGKRLLDFTSAPAAFATNASLCWRTKLKQRKSFGEENQNKNGKSQGRWKTRYKSRVVVQRSKSSNQRKDTQSLGGPTKRIQRNLLHFPTNAAAAQRFMLERAVAAIIQMLLVRSGIETNPGPTTPAGRYP